MPDAGPISRFRRAFLRGESFTGAEVRDRFGVSTTALPNTVHALRSLGYIIESTPEGDTTPKRVRHRIVNVGHIPAVPPVQHNNGAASIIRDAMDAGEVIDKEWCERNDIRPDNVRAFVQRDRTGTYNRVGPFQYAKAPAAKSARRTRRNATDTRKPRASDPDSVYNRVRSRLTRGLDVTPEWIEAEGIKLGVVHTAIYSLRKRGVEIERIPRGGYAAPRGRALKALVALAPADDDGGAPPPPPAPKSTAIERVGHHIAGAPPDPSLAYPMLGEPLIVRGISLTDDGTLQIALRNGSVTWVAEVTGQHHHTPTVGS